MKAVAGSLTYDTKIDNNGFEKGLKKLGSVGSTVLKGITTAMATTITGVTTAITGLSIAAVNSYADLEQNVGGVETLFKNSADKVIKNAENAYKTAGMSANQYMSTVTSFSASLLQSLGGDTEKAAEVADMALIDMADNANKMGTSMEDIQNAYQGFAKQNYTMLDNLKLGYGGTKTEMERLLQDAQKITGIEYNIDNLSDVYNAIHVIQGELGITGTTAQEAASTISGSVSSMKAAWDNFLNGSGTLDSFIETAITSFKNIMGAVEKLIPDIITSIVNAIPQIVSAINEIFPQIINLLVNQLPVLIEQLGIILNAILQILVSYAPQLIPIILQTIMMIVDVIIQNLPLLISAAVQIIVALCQGLAQSLPQLIPEIINAIILIVETLLNNIDQLIDAGIQLIIGLAEGLINAIPILIEKAPVILEKLIIAIANNLPKIIEAGIKIIIKLGEGLIKAIPQLIANVPKVITSLIEGFGQFLSNMWDVGQDLVKGIWDGIKNAKDWLIGKVKEWCGNILDGIKSFFGIHSPSKVMRDEIGKFIPQGIAVGIEADTNKAVKAIDGMNDEIMSEMKRAVAMETGSINAKASVKSNNSMLNVIKANFNIDGSVDIDGQKAGRILTPSITKTIKVGGLV